MAQFLEKEFVLVVRSEKKRGYHNPVLLAPRVAVDAKRLSLKPGEVPIRVTLKLPLTLFTVPQFRATISVSEKSVTGQVVDAEVISNIEQLVLENTGITLEISQVEGNDG